VFRSVLAKLNTNEYIERARMCLMIRVRIDWLSEYTAPSLLRSLIRETPHAPQQMKILGYEHISTISTDVDAPRHATMISPVSERHASERERQHRELAEWKPHALSNHSRQP